MDSRYLLTLAALLATTLLSSLGAQSDLRVLVISELDELAISNATIFVAESKQTVTTNTAGSAILPIEENTGGVTLTVFKADYASQTISVELPQRDTVVVRLQGLNLQLDAVTITAQRKANVALRRLRAVEGTAIYAGKKTEVVSVEALTANKAANQARQLYARVSGLNIYESDDAGLQLSIGGRGLDPNRTASFNTRQNGYDISADVLGYPESYYTPPAEALQEIQVIRGAASLQYGTQFGGMINFVFHQPQRDDKIEFISRQTVGSYGLFTSFNSLSGTVGNVGYYGYINYKRGDGFRPNSGFDSRNAFVHFDYAVNERTKISAEYTYLDYLAQQAGGLTDAQFYADPFQSNRNRNWFDVDWQLFSARVDHKVKDRTNLSLNLFGLRAARSAVGFRSNRVSQIDDLEAPRDLLIGKFRNAGAELRGLHRYHLGERRAVGLLGAKYYHASNSAIQGPGTAEQDADFSVASDRFPSYPSQSDFDFPNRNLAFFGENIINLTDRLSITPGIRYEYINTRSDGHYRRIDFDLAGEPIRDTLFTDNREFKRNLLLLGVGASYLGEGGFECYANISQNYRSVTFNDIRTVNPSFQVDPYISDEDGYTADLGIRYNRELWRVHANLFGLRYNDRLGEVLTPETIIRADGQVVRTGRIIRLRTNIGSAFIYGLESLVEWTALTGKNEQGRAYRLTAFANTSLTRSRYTESAITGVEDKEVEFVPALNLRTGLQGGWGNFLGALQYSYLSDQFTDASNAPQDKADNQSGIVGTIPAYGILDLSFGYRLGIFNIDAGVSNLLDEVYFTRRATGYPGPGIIPSAPRSFYLTLGVTL